MSKASMAVLFPDGTIRYGVYSGTVDIAGDALYDTVREAWDRWGESSQPGDGAEQDVVIYSDYGGGFWWHGRATTSYLVGPRAPFDCGCSYYAPSCDHKLPEVENGMPGWVMWK